MRFSIGSRLVSFAALFMASQTGCSAVAPNAQEIAINTRDSKANGIRVESPKVYDDSVLQDMLRAAEARLAALQLIDQSGISSRIGGISGATQTTSSFGLSIQASPLPQVVTTNTGPTSSTVATNQTVGTVSDPPSTVNTAGTVTTNGAPSTSAVTTSAPLSPPAVSAPAPTTTLPGGIAPSASAILKEQLELTYEIANLRLLLEGALSDRVVGTHNRVRPHVTLGFPISIAPNKTLKNAVAVVEIEVDANTAERPDGAADDMPAVLALLPQDKTYNVAAITDRSSSIGGGIVTQVVGISASFAHGHKTYYMAQDQDTLALSFDPDGNTTLPPGARKVGFMWQFRPVLGERYVRTGLKQTFVQLAFPNLLTAAHFGQVRVRTYWRCYDRKHNVVRAVIPGSLRAAESDSSIRNYARAQEPLEFNPSDLEDLGNGQMLVTVKGLFLGGTYIRIGSNLLREGSPTFLNQYSQIQFTAPILDLATQQVALVSRNGLEYPLKFSRDIYNDQTALKIRSYQVTTLDNSRSELVVVLNRPPDMTAPPVVLIGPHVFGYADAPLRWRDSQSFSVAVPTALLRDHGRFFVRALFTDEDYWKEATRPLGTSPLAAAAPVLRLLADSKDSAAFLLYGDDLAHTTVLAPRAHVTSYGSPALNNVRLVEIRKSALKEARILAVQDRRGELMEVAIPDSKKADEPKPSTATILPPAPIAKDADEIVLLGTELSAVRKAIFKSIDLKIQKQDDGKAVWLGGLRAAGVTAMPGAAAIEIDFTSGKTSVTVNVVAPAPAGPK